MPDLVFLDIQMPEFTGFEVISQLDIVPMIVFVTAYQEYAVKAFEKNSLDYLLKPVEEDRLRLTIDRILEKKAGETDIMVKIQQLIGEIGTEKSITTIPVKIGNKINLIHIADIHFFEAKDKYVFIHTAENESLTDYSLSSLQQRLPSEFIRVHRSFIINKMKVKEIQKYFKGTYIFVMNNEKRTKIRTASSYYESIKTRLLNP